MGVQEVPPQTKKNPTSFKGILGIVKSWGADPN